MGYTISTIQTGTKSSGILSAQMKRQASTLSCPFLTTRMPEAERVGATTLVLLGQAASPSGFRSPAIVPSIGCAAVWKEEVCGCTRGFTWASSGLLLLL